MTAWGRCGKLSHMNVAFVPGLELARLYYAEAVRPLLDQEFPRLRHSAALIGWGSDVLGFDSPRSADHNWGPRCQVFLNPADASRSAEITDLLSQRLPATFRGWPTAFLDVTAPGDGPRHWVEVAELGAWLTGMLGFDPRRDVTELDWLSAPTQRLAEVSAGVVFHDGLDALGGSSTLGRSGDPGSSSTLGGPSELDGSGRAQGHARAHLRGSPGDLGGLGAARSRLAWYPRDIWLYVLACQWQRIGQEEAFPGRCAEAGDELGSAMIAARLVRDLMRLVLLMQRRYPLYSKWLGTTFSRLPSAAPLVSLLSGVISAVSWAERERSLCAAYVAAAQMHNELGITEPVDVATRGYYDRPYQVLDAGRLVEVLRSAITDPEIRRLPLIGAVDQFVDSTDAIGDLALLRAAVAAGLSHGADSPDA